MRRDPDRHDRDGSRSGKGSSLEPGESQPTPPTLDEYRTREGLERRRAQLGCEPCQVCGVLAALSTAPEVHVQHPDLELRQLVVEPQRNLRSNALTCRRGTDGAHVRCDDTTR